MRERLDLEATLTPGGTGQFEVKVDGVVVVRRGGNLITRRFGAGYPDFDVVIQTLKQRTG